MIDLQDLEVYVKEYTKFKIEKVKELSQLYKQKIYANDYLLKRIETMNPEVAKKRESLKEEFKNKLNSLIDTFQKDLSKKPENYDLKMNTEVILINSLGNNLTEKELKEILNPFKYDYKSICTLYKIIKQNGADCGLWSFYENVDIILKKLYQGIENSDNFFTLAEINLNDITAYNGEIYSTMESINLEFWISEMQKKIKNLYLVIEDL